MVKALMSKTSKGLMISGLVLWGLVCLVAMRALGELGALALVIALVPVFCLILWSAGTRIQTKRFRKLFFLGLSLEYLGGLLLAAFFILTDNSKMIGVAAIPYSIFMLGTTGFFILGTLLLPFLLLGVYGLERWTRQKVDLN